MTKDNKQYFIVGIFVVATIILLLSVWLWFTTSNRESYNIYLTTFNEPVDGLTVGAAVKYNGVEIGRVKKIKLNQNNPRNIFVYLDILDTIPINKKTIASLKSIGVTGMSYIELRLPPDANLNNNIKPHNKEPYPQIQTQVSLLYSLSEQAQSVSSNIQDISGQVKKLFSDQNIKQFSQVLNNLSLTSDTIVRNSNKISTTIGDLSVIMANIKASTKNIEQTVENIDSLTQSLTKTSNSTNDLINNFNNNTLNSINYNLLPNIEQSVSQINQMSSHLGDLIIMLNQNPSALIKGVENKTTGPGEQK